ncbi:hypothetical protein D9O40_09025 [Clostridium autoethanogenum]|uniref:Uncharacterized protein n=1 Tax=Clostridium autoethanogenum TaxID=84023 RepID=A0A3M0SRZ1_9CLOT|nr:ATP-binding protein [Clostridium autoethanogenum]RMD01100.1 hypothetical protein D9O40_09025 [Clostridium autoethanogenum]
MSIIRGNHLNNSKIVGGDDRSTTIYTNSVVENLPQLDEEYQHRDEEKLIIKKLSELRIICICGISGLGKTSTSIAIANEIGSEYTNIIYIDGMKLKTTNGMNNIFYIDKLGYKENLESILTRQKTLLIIDNVIENQSNIVEKIKSMKLTESEVIITTQSVNYVDKDYVDELKTLKNDICKKILLKGVDIEIEDKYINDILMKISNNPLMIKIVNRLLKDGITLKELCEDEGQIMKAEDIETQQNISQRIMRTFIKTCDEEIKVLYWLSSTYIDKGLLCYMLKHVGFKKIENRGIFDRYNSININTIKVHDLILNAIKSIVNLSENENLDYTKKFINYFKKLSNEKVEGNKYCNALYMHKEKINEINVNNNNWGIEIYLLLKCSYDYEFNYNKWDNIKYLYLKNCNYTDEYYFHYISVIEFLERKKNYSKLWSGNEEHDKFIRQCIDIIEEFLKNDTLNDKIKLYLTHHLGKFYIYNKQDKMAIEKFEYIVNKDNKYYAAKLQLIRLYQKYRNIQKSKKYISEILDNYNNGYQIDTTVVLATFLELRKKEFKDELNKYVLENLEVFSKTILQSSNFYFDLPFKVFVALGKKFSYKHPELYKKIAKSIPMKLSDNINDDNMLFSMGEFYKDFIKSNIWNDAINNEEKKFLLLEAEKCYNKMVRQSDFQITSIVGFYVLAKKPKEALKRSTGVKNKDEPFIYYYMSQAFELIFKESGENDSIVNALSSIDESIRLAEDSNKFNTFLSTFYRQKAKVLFLNRDIEYIHYYKKAIKSTNENKFKDQLYVELKKDKDKFIR